MIILTWALTWPLNSVSATCWGSFTWLMQLARLLHRRQFCQTTLGSLQIEASMILVFISASLWGCLGCEESLDGALPQNQLNNCYAWIYLLGINQWELHFNFSHSLTISQKVLRSWGMILHWKTTLFKQNQTWWYIIPWWPPYQRHFQIYLAESAFVGVAIEWSSSQNCFETPVEKQLL